MAVATIRDSAQLPAYLMRLNELQKQIQELDEKIKEASLQILDEMINKASRPLIRGKRKSESDAAVNQSMDELTKRKLTLEQEFKKQEKPAIDFIDSLERVKLINLFRLLSSEQSFTLPTGEVGRVLQYASMRLCQDFKIAEGSYGAEAYDPQEKIRRKHSQFKLECAHRWFPSVRELPASIRGFLIWGAARESPTEQLKLWKVVSCPGMHLTPQIRKVVADFVENQCDQTKDHHKRPKIHSKKNELSLVIRTLESFSLVARDSQLTLTSEESKALMGLLRSINANKSDDEHGPAVTFRDVTLIMRAMENIPDVQNSSYWFDPLADMIAYVIGHPRFFDPVFLQKLIPPSKNGLMHKVKEQLWNTLMQYGNPTDPLRNDKKVIHLLGVLAEPTPEFAKKMSSKLTKMQLNPYLPSAAHTIAMRSEGTKLFAQTALLMMLEKRYYTEPSKEWLELMLSGNRCYPENDRFYFPQLNVILRLYVLLSNHFPNTLPEDFCREANASFDEYKTESNSVHAVLNQHINYVFSGSEPPKPDEALGVMTSLVAISKEHRFELSSAAASNFYYKLLDIDIHLLDEHEIPVLMRTLQQLIASYPLRCANIFKDKIILEFLSHLITYHHDPKNSEETDVILNILNACMDSLDKDFKAQHEPSPELAGYVDEFEAVVEKIQKSLNPS